MDKSKDIVINNIKQKLEEINNLINQAIDHLYYAEEGKLEKTLEKLNLILNAIKGKLLWATSFKSN